jgi:hypothetical protein
MRCSASWLAVLVCITPILSAQTAEPPAGVLIRIRSKAIDNLDRQPNYTCTETIERSRRLKATGKFQLIDTIRLEVALVEGKEMFGWPGATKFEDTELRHFVREGAIGNGSFALHARAVFSGEATRFVYNGDGVSGDHGWVRFVFSVPLARSGYSIQNNGEKAVVAYHGSFDADSNSFDLLRMEVVADELPPQLHLEKAVSIVDYVRTKIGDNSFLLPSSSELSMVDPDGTENRNQIRFASCHQFSGESTLRFDDAPDTLTVAKPTDIAEVVLPGDMGLMLALVDEVDLSAAATGDPVRARLVNDLKSKGHVLIPKNAIATGRIMRIERHSEAVMVGLRFDEIEAPGVRSQLHLRLDDVMNADHLAGKFRYLLSPLNPGEGVLPLGPGRGKLNRGLLMNWSTQR